MPLTIALVTGEYPPMKGGVGAFTQELARALAARGNSVHVITSRLARPAENRPSSASLGDALRRLNDVYEPIALPHITLHARGRRWRWGEMNMIADLTERFGFDVVNIQYQAAAFNMRSPAVNFLPWRLRGMTQTVVTYHDLRVPYLFPKAGRLRPWIVRQMARQAQGAIVTNEEDYDDLVAAIDTPVRQIPIGSNITVHDPNHIELQEARESAGLAVGEPVIGFFGFMNATKGADLLVEAMTHLGKRVQLVLIGGRVGSSDSAGHRLFLDRVQRVINAFRLEERVHWTGFLSDLRVSALLNVCDLIVLPYRDGVSLRRGTLMAALAHGRPIITTEPGRPVGELRHGENIWLVPPGEVSPLVEAIQLLLADEALRRRLGAAARATSDRFTWKKIAKETASFYRELLGRD